MKIKYIQHIPLNYDFISYSELLEETEDGVFTAFYNDKIEDTSWVAVLHNNQLYYAEQNRGALYSIDETLNLNGWKDRFFIRMENPLQYKFAREVRNVNTREVVIP